jgi:serine protease Do
VDVAALLEPSVVSIHTYEQRGFGRMEGKGLGTGIVLDEEGHILTNAHVVLDRGRPADRYRVVLEEYGAVEARFVGADELTDLAVLKIDVPGLYPARLGDSELIRLGEMVMAIGTPFGLDDSVSLGIVSALGRSELDLTEYENYIQTDAAINPGNSGGPLVNLRGEVIGVNSAIRSQNKQYAGIGFAIPVNTARYVADALIREGRVRRGYLGVTLEDVYVSRPVRVRGVRIREVVDGTAAREAGLRVDDVIVAIEDRPVRSMPVLRDRIAHTPPGTTVRLTVVRDDEEMEVEVSLKELPARSR